MQENICADLKRFLNKQTLRRPLIMPVILEAERPRRPEKPQLQNEPKRLLNSTGRQASSSEFKGLDVV